MTHETDILSDILEEYLEEARSGREPDLEEYTRRHPELESRIRELFPMAALVEEAARKPVTGTSPGSTPLAGNPYLCRVMIEDPALFFGRRRDLARIFSRIGGRRPQCVSVVGERRIGKSSLLNAITWRKTQLTFLPDPDPLLYVFVDFQQLPRVTLQDFFDLLIDRLVQASSIASPQRSDNRYRNFQGALDQLRAREKKLVLLFDEFDAVTSNPEFGPDFYSFLRSCANNYSVAYVTSSRTDLQRLCHSSAVADSPFFNIFSSLYLRGFESREAVDLIRIPSSRAGVPLADHAESILRLAGHFPFYLQIACSVHYEWCVENPGAPPPAEEMKERFLEEASPHFTYFWSHCQPAEKEVLRKLAQDRQPDPEQMFWSRALERSGYIIREEQTYRPFSDIFSEQISMLDSHPEGAGHLVPGESGDTLAGLEEGQELQQYRILHELGRGGMGVVYLAEDQALCRRVALKLCHPELVFSRIARRRTLQEARTTAALQHPGIAGIHELLEYHGLPVIVMEWVEGRTLAQIVAEKGALPWRLVVEWMIQTCRALSYAHDKGLIHRDIKPSNLMVTNDNEVKLTDFGLAKWQLETSFTTKLTVSGGILGTVNYMSPEQARGEPLDSRSDLFSLGIVTFEALTARLPFEREDLPSTLHAILNDPAPYVGLFHVENAARLDRVLRKLLAKNSQDRFQSADDARAAFEDLRKSQRSWFSRLKASWLDFSEER